MIGRKYFLILMFRMFSAILGFVGLFLITRNFSKEAFGAITWTMALIASFNSFADLGFASAHTKRVSEGKDINDCLSTFIVIKLTLTAAMVVIVGISFLFMTSVMGLHLEDTSVDLIILFILYYVLYDIAIIATTTFDAKMETAKTQISMFMDILVRVPLIFFMVSIAGGENDLAICYVLGALAVAIVSITLLFRSGIKLVKPTLFRSYSKFALPIALTVVVGIVVLNVDKIYLGIFWTDTTVGTYAASQSVISMVSVIGGAAGTLLYPTMSMLNERDDKNSLNQIVDKSERYLSFILTPIVCIMIIFSSGVSLVILGERYSGAGEPMKYLAVSMLMSALSSVYSTHILAMNKLREVVWISFFQLGVLVVLLTIMVPQSIFGVELLGLGIIGAALAVTITIILFNIVTRYIIWKITGLGFNRRMFKHIVAAAVVIIALIVLSFVYSPARWYELAMVWVIAAGLFYAVTYALGELEKEDIHYVVDVIHPIKMVKYIKEEIKGKK